MHIQEGFLRRRQQTGGGGNGDENGNSNPAGSSAVSATLSAASQTASQSAAETAFAEPSATSPADNSTSNGKAGIIVPVLVVFIVFLLSIFSVVICRSCRRKHKNPKYIPTAFLKKRWERWDIKPSAAQRLSYASEHLEQRRSGQPPSVFDLTAGGTLSGAAATNVNRNTSVRSVMTLPAYNMSARENEQVLGREGERGGIDTVIEFPEGVDEEEQRREEEMEALYQVRLARRRETEEREERRRLRREARERGDSVALRDLQERARTDAAASAGRSVAELRAEHDRLKNERLRAVSAVSYGDLGVARHDGTRLRANSEESERQGLLGDAASIAASSRYHRRDRSSGSVISIDTLNTDLPSPGLPRSRANSNAESPLRRVSTASHDDRAGSSPEMIDHDHAVEDIPPNSPPGYENISLNTPLNENPPGPPPDYTSPVLARGEGPSIDSALSAAENETSTPAETPSALPAQTNRTATSNSSSSRVSTRGVGGVPQLPSLRLASLPSIVVDTGTPVARHSRIQEEDASQ